MNDLVLSFGTEKSGHAWLYSDCWSAWHRLRASQNDAFEERTAIIEYDAGVPRSWAETFARLNIADQLPGFQERFVEAADVMAAQ